MFKVSTTVCKYYILSYANTKGFIVLCRHLLMCRVTLGKSFVQYNAIKIAHAPPGHHSVMGTPSVGGLNFSEYVVYRGEQVFKHKHITFYKLSTNVLHNCNFLGIS